MRLYFVVLFFIYSTIFSQSVLKEPAKNENATYNVKLLPFNTKASEFCPSIYKDGIIFCSDRDQDFGVVYRSEYNEKPLIDYYFTTSVSGKNWTKPKRFDKTLCSNMSEGPLCFNADYTKVYFTRNQANSDRTRLYIFESNFENGQWTEPKIMPFINEKFSYGHPTISSNGAFMIFSSNLAGGNGGTDLYISYFKEGNWTKPSNLGKPINSTKNEIMPFLHPSGLLYFASDAQGGLGGFDIYSTFYSQFEWKNVKNIGYPFNTSFNDYGFYINNDFSSGYFTSNRLNGKDDDDIYSFNTIENMFTNCDSLRKDNLCRTFFEEGTIPTENSPLVYEWDLGDGTKKRGNEVKHCFAKPGIYNIQLNVVDLISNQVLLNEATYEFEIEGIKSAFIQIPDTLITFKNYIFDGSKSTIDGINFKPIDYAWDFGTGEIFSGVKPTYNYHLPSNYKIKLNVKFIDSTMNIRNSCVTRNIQVMTQKEYTEALINKSKPKLLASDWMKKIYNIKDSEGNVYKIQIGTAKKSKKEHFKKFEGTIKVEEYYDRNVYGYTTGNYKSAQDAIPDLKLMRKIGFKEAVLIAQNNGKVVSGTDSSFFVNIDESMTPLKIITFKGNVKDKDGNPIKANFNYQNLSTTEVLGNKLCDNPIGYYDASIADGDIYGYFISAIGYFPYSNNIDLRSENSVSEINNDIILYKAEEVASSSIPIRINNIFFQPDKFELQPESYPELLQLANFIKENNTYKYEIGGHSDHLGDENYNMKLSEKRATEVTNYLINNGCLPQNLTTKGYGNAMPITTNRKYLELNRRVEIKISQ